MVKTSSPPFAGHVKKAITDVPDAVIDTSALIEVLTSATPDPALRRRVALCDLAAPELIDLESVNVLRRLVRHGKLAEGEAGQVLDDIMQAPVARCPHRPLVRRIWDLRGSVGSYDAAYVALAEQLGVPLITCDAKLAGANGHAARIELHPVT